MILEFEDVAAAASRLLEAGDSADVAKDSGWACAWLQACGYPGLEILIEALETTPADRRHPVLEPDSLGLDLGNVSCVFVAPVVAGMVERRGRLFLRNVRHGLYLVPFSVRANLGIGCPVDPAFALGGERSKNPYEEKLALARQSGIAVADAIWDRAQSLADS